MAISAKPGPGRAVLSGDTKQRVTREVAQRPSAGVHFLFVSFLCASKENTIKLRQQLNTVFAFSKPSVILHYNTTRESRDSVRTRMTNLQPHRRLRIPNSLAMLAAVLLLVTSVVSFNPDQEVLSPGQKAIPSLKVDTNINDSAENKRRGLNLGLLLFRRG